MYPGDKKKISCEGAHESQKLALCKGVNLATAFLAE